MTSLPGNTSGTARLLLDAPAYAVGWQEVLYVPNPAAGQSWAHKCDGRFYERVVAIAFTFSASAVVANRFLQMYLFDQNGRVITSVPCAATVVANTTIESYLQLNAPSYANSPSGGAPGFMPDIMMHPDWQWSCTAFGEDAGDQFSQIVLLVQRYPNDTAAVSAVG